MLFTYNKIIIVISVVQLPILLYHIQKIKTIQLNAGHFDSFPLSNFIFVKEHVGNPIFNGKFSASFRTFQFSVNYLNLENEFKRLILAIKLKGQNLLAPIEQKIIN